LWNTEAATAGANNTTKSSVARAENYARLARLLALSQAPLSTAPLSTALAGALASALQLQYDKCAHGNEQSRTNAHAANELPRRWLIFRCGHRRGKRCDVAAGCRRSKAHEFRAELAHLSYLERQPPRMRSCIMRLTGSAIFVSPSAFQEEKCRAHVFYSYAKTRTKCNNLSLR
jgi:hypothetical protein